MRGTTLVYHLLAGEQDLYLAEMATRQDREAEDPRIRQLCCADSSVGRPSGTLAKGNNLRRRDNWVFASEKTHGKTPRFGGMLVRDYLCPAAEHAGIIFKQRDGSYVDSTGPQGHAFRLSQPPQGGFRLPERGEEG